MVANHTVRKEEVQVTRRFTGEAGGRLEAVYVDDMGGMLVLLDVEVGEDAMLEAAGRDLVSRLQKLKKRAGVAPQDKLLLAYQVMGREEAHADAMRHLLRCKADPLRAALGYPLLELPHPSSSSSSSSSRGGLEEGEGGGEEGDVEVEGGTRGLGESGEGKVVIKEHMVDAAPALLVVGECEEEVSPPSPLFPRACASLLCSCFSCHSSH